ncbi:MAG: transcription antitermination factor NusB [Oscillospiraceae bacterium]|jgi:N utilization substance protein B|nr:transcription antitermination factor NusB [Oscillospiraceae bacterium]
MNRRQVRDNAFKILFQESLRNGDISGIYEACAFTGEISIDEKVRELVAGTLLHSDEFDEIIGKYSPKRSVKRIAKLNLTIIKLALYEMFYDEGTPVNAAISEAMILADRYTYDEDMAFINGVLGAASRQTADT